MKKKILRILAVLLTAVMLLSLIAACGNNDNENGDNDNNGSSGNQGGQGNNPGINIDTPDFVFRPQIVNLPPEITDMRNLVYTDGKLFFWSHVILDRETWESEVRIYSLNIDGTGLTQLPNYTLGGEALLQMASGADDGTDSGTDGSTDGATDGTADNNDTTDIVNPEGDNASNTNKIELNFYINSLVDDNEGNIWVMESGQMYRLNVPEDFDGEEWEKWNYYEDLGSATFMRKIDSTGREISALDISTIFSGFEWFYIAAMNVDKDGNIYLSSNEGIFILNSDGELLFTIRSEGWGDQLIRLPSGEVAYWGYVDDMQNPGYSLQLIDVNEKGFGDTVPMPNNIWSVQPGGGDYALIYQEGLNLFGIIIDPDSGETEAVKLLNWIESDIVPNNIENIMMLPDGRVLCTNSSWDRFSDSQNFELNILTKIPYSELPARTLISLATIYMDWNLRGYVVEFNRTNENYRIHIIDYSEFNTEDDWNAGLTRLSTDIIAGRIPDILDVTYLPFAQYVSRGLLVDLYPMIDNDPNVNRSDFIEPVLRAAQSGDGLYRAFNSFSVATILGSPSVLGPGMGWNMDEFNSVMSANPRADMPMGQWLTKEWFLNSAIAINMDEYVDWVTGNVNFDSNDFIQLLEFANTFPADFDYMDDGFGGGMWVDESELIASGRQIMVSREIGDFRDIQMYKAYFGGEIVFKGFPNDNRNGNSLRIGSSLSITSRSNNKEGAWEFLRGTLTPEFAATNIWWPFPVNKEAFNKVAEAAMAEEGYEMTIGWGRSPGDMGITIEMKPITQVEIDMFMDLVNSASGIVFYNEALLNIISEDTSDFFNGRRSAQETARVIQNRVRIFVSEQS